MAQRFLNLGCGGRFHRDWVNLDLHPSDPCVQKWDLQKGFPFAAESFEVVYHSHVLEHFPKRVGFNFLRECHRVLRPGGVIRVAVPDLESIVRLYLEALEKASRGEPHWRDNYEFMVLEMYDQAVREKPYGELFEYFRRDLPNWDFVLHRWGVYANALLEASRARPDSAGDSSLAQYLGYILRNPGAVLRNKLLRMLLSEDDLDALQIGRFRKAGDPHQWMYDSYSLARLLEATGFSGPRRYTAMESRIPGWSNFHLDSEPDGTIYKPDSLYMEALKP